MTSKGFYTPQFDVPEIAYPKIVSDDAAHAADVRPLVGHGRLPARKRLDPSRASGRPRDELGARPFAAREIAGSLREPFFIFRARSPGKTLHADGFRLSV